MDDGAPSRLRGWWKIVVLVFSLCQCVVNFLPVWVFLAGNSSELSGVRRAEWLHRSCRLVLRRLRFDVRIRGEFHRSGLIASNHLSYLDILFYGATLPCVFVAKQEVRSWPLLGLLAAMGGTVFIDRKSVPSAAAAAARVETLLTAGVAVLVFPEGTSSDGGVVLRFYPSLFEPAVRVAAPVTASAIGYTAGAGVRERDLCYYGDISFAPHLLKTLRLPKIVATLRFAPLAKVYGNRKEAAAQTWDAVVELRSETGRDGSAGGGI